MEACKNCGYEPLWRERWRPKTDAMSRKVYVAGNLLLETYNRYICACSAKSQYKPIDGLQPPQMAWSEPPAAKRR